MATLSYDECCRIILNDPKTNAYAKAYAKAGLGFDGEYARVQSLYILNNITSWRGERAKQVRESLKQHSKK